MIYSPLASFFVILFFVVGVLLGATLVWEYYEKGGCLERCSGEIKFDQVWDGEDQYRKL